MKQHLMTGAAAAAAVVQMPRPINWPRRGRLSFLSALLVFLATFGLSAQIPGACNNPISGKGVVVDDLSAGLINLLATNPNLNNILDGDLNNFAEFAGLGSIAVGNLQLVNVKDVNNTYPAGRRTGFVIEATGGLLSLDLLNGLAIQTSLNNVVQETVAISNGSGGGINLSLLSAENAGRRRVDFLTSLPFDEVALVKTGLLNTELDGLRVYYAYEEVDGCDYDCSTAITTANFPLASVSSGGGGLLGLASFGPTANVIDPDTTNFATSAIGVLAAPFIEVNTGTLISGGNDVGFVIETAGLLGTGLLNLSLLDGVTITTYSVLGTPLEVFDAGSGLASVGLLSGTNVASISFKTTLPFASVRIAYPSVLNLSSRRVYYAFVRFDDDGDGFPNCVDKCPGGSDALDADGDGVPDACDMDCALAPIAPVKVCPDGLTSTAQLPAAGPGQVWSADPGNPAAATIDNNGLVSGLTVQGIYSFTLTDPSIPGCSQTVTVDFRQASVDTDCNDPVSGPGTIVGNLPGCTLCASPDAGNLTDGDLSNAVSTASLLNLGLLGSATPLISVVDTTQIYPGGTRAGFVVQTGGLLNAGLLSGFQIRTYLDGVPVEVSGTGGSLLGADALAPSGQQRVSFVTTLPYNEIEVVLQGGILDLGLLSTVDVFYAFVEPVSCPGGDGATDNIADTCGEVFTANSFYCASINYARTQLPPTACVGCSISSISNVIDDDLSNATPINLLVGALGDASVSILLPEPIPAGKEAGFVYRIDGGLLSADVLNGLTVTTYLNGTVRESVTGGTGLLNLGLLSGGSGNATISFPTSLSFDEIQFSINATVAAGVAAGTVNLLYGFARGDEDGDGVPDCLDKCCLGDDNLDVDGDGIPDACDNNLPMAVDDMVSVPEDAVDFVLNVVGNDDFGLDGPALAPISIVTAPANGIASVDDNGTPANPTDDTILYTPGGDFFGADSLAYAICDFDGDCDTAVVSIMVENINDAPVANDDTAMVDEDNPLMGNVVLNDIDVDGPDTLITLVAGPMNGMLTLNLDGTFTYTPDPDFNGMDIFEYSYCDGGTPELCDTASVDITVNAVNDAPIANNDTFMGVEDMPLMGDVSLNDIDVDGPDTLITLVAGPMNGMLTLNLDGTFTYTPDLDFNGMDTFEYSYCDGGTPELCDTASVDITVNAVNDAPIANNDAFMGAEDMPLMGDVSLNDIDVDGPDTLITLVAGPMNGMLTLNLDGTFTYTPDMDFNGMDTFQYSYCDDGVPNLCDTATANINLAPVNDPPRITQNGNDVDTIFVTVPEDMIDTTCVTVIDVDGDMVACSLISLPMNGTAALLNDTCIVYQPDMNYFGPDQTIKIADDGNGGTDTVVVIYDVTPVNDPPVAMDDTYNVVQGNTLMATVIANDVDVDGPDTLVTLVAGPFNGMLMLNLDGSFSYTPNGGFTGTDTFQYAYCDGGTPELCDTAMVAINVADNVLNIRPVVLLQGALLGNGGGLLMRDDLRSGGYIPTVEPYSGLASFEHRNGGGGETITMPATVLADSGANSIVDWVFVELRSAADSAQVVATRSALVQRDGDVVDVDGTSAVMFPGVIDGDYFVSIRHRNHLGAMTAGAVSLSSVAMVIDFTDINTDFYNRIAQFDGFEQATVEGAYALYLGNTNFNDRVNYAGQANDTDAIFQAIVNDAGNPGMLQSFVIDRYISTDVNLDGLTKYTGLANDVDPVFNVAVTSALNGSGIVTFNLVEQLPDSGGL